VREEAIDLGFRDAVMPTRGVRRAHYALMNPLLERRVAHAEAMGRCACGEECHVDSSWFQSI
jgi:hypothetical protein